MTDVDVGYEILSCPKCLWVGSPRPAIRKWILPCSNCGATELLLSDLTPTNVRPVTSRMRPSAQPDKPAFQGGVPHDATRDSGRRSDPRPGASAPAPAPAPAAQPAARQLSEREASIDSLLAP